MAQLAGFELESRNADWTGAEFTAESRFACLGVPPQPLVFRVGGPGSLGKQAVQDTGRGIGVGDRDGDLTFENKRMNGARFHIVDLTDARFDHVRMRGVAMRGVELVDVEIDGEVWNVTINGVDVAPLIEAELDRRYPDRSRCAPPTPAGFREAWDVIERLWAAPSSGPDGCRPSCSTSRSTASGRSSRRCDTSRSPPTPGCAGPSSATRRRGTRWTCRWTRCPTPPAFRAIVAARPSLDEALALRHDRMATCARSSTASPTSRSPTDTTR